MSEIDGSEGDRALWHPPAAPDLGPDVVSTLRAVPLFTDLREAALRKVAQLVHERSYRSGEVIFREGEPGAGVYIIRRGAVHILIALPGGGEKIVAALAEKQFFGEMALLEQAPRSATCMATQDTELLGFFQPDLEDLIERDAPLGSAVLWNLARLLAARLRTMNESFRAAQAKRIEAGA